jgi:hypothetical protein
MEMPVGFFELEKGKGLLPKSTALKSQRKYMKELLLTVLISIATCVYAASATADSTTSGALTGNSSTLACATVLPPANTAAGAVPRQLGPNLIDWKYLNQTVSAAAITSTAIYAATADTLYRSVDGGCTWTLLKSFPHATEFRAIYVAGNGSIYISALSSGEAPYMSTDDTGLWRSTDGTNFTRVLALGTQECIWAIDEDASGNIYAGVYHLSAGNNASIYKSTDSGGSFSKVYAGGTNRHVHGLSVDRLNGYVYVVVGDNGSNKTALLSKDGGASWNLFLTSMEQMTSVLATPTGRLFGSDHHYIGRIYRTTDDTTTTVTLDSWYQNCFFIRRNPLTGNIYAGFKLDPTATSPLTAGVYLSRDDGVTWQAIQELENLIPGEGYWFSSQFYDGKLIVGYKKGADWQKGIVIEDKEYLPTITASVTGTPPRRDHQLCQPGQVQHK